jgi:hypothetical protein
MQKYTDLVEKQAKNEWKIVTRFQVYWLARTLETSKT